MVNSLDFQSGNEGSIPFGTTKIKTMKDITPLFVKLKPDSSLAGLLQKRLEITARKLEILRKEYEDGKYDNYFKK